MADAVVREEPDRGIEVGPGDNIVVDTVVQHVHDRCIGLGQEASTSLVNRSDRSLELSTVSAEACGRHAQHPLPFSSMASIHAKASCSSSKLVHLRRRCHNQVAYIMMSICFIVNLRHKQVEVAEGV